MHLRLDVANRTIPLITIRGNAQATLPHLGGQTQHSAGMEISRPQAQPIAQCPTTPRSADFQQGGQRRFIESLQTNHHLRQTILQTTAQSWSKGALPNVIIDRNHHVHPRGLLTNRCQKACEAQGRCGIRMNAFKIIRHQHHSTDQREQGHKGRKTLDAGIGDRSLNDHSRPSWMLRHGGSKTKQRAQPKRAFTQGRTRAPVELKCQTRTQNFKILFGPVRRDRLGMMKIESLHRTPDERTERGLAVITRHLARTDQRLQGQGKKATSLKVQAGQTTTGRQRASQTP
ncbi:MAG: hypothetical protein EAZ65_02295 [Verrucomicrobia bacterium]|nr:MAG: hypothetical protein EAZ65_02295 [Verrucomicrobiota bacterium]